jgi:hypothetical protein
VAGQPSSPVPNVDSRNGLLNEHPEVLKQSARSLRGSKLGDLMVAGTSKWRAGDVCRVGLGPSPGPHVPADLHKQGRHLIRESRIPLISPLPALCQQDHHPHEACHASQDDHISCHEPCHAPDHFLVVGRPGRATGNHLDELRRAMVQRACCLPIELADDKGEDNEELRASCQDIERGLE